MIPGLLVLAGFLLVVVPGATQRTARLQPKGWARSVATSLVVGLSAIELGLMTLAAPALSRIPGMSSIADSCSATVGAFSLGGVLGGWIAGVLAAVIGLRVVRTVSRSFTTTKAVVVEPWFGAHERRDDFELVLLPSDHVLAMSVPGRDGQIVITQGLVDRLGPEQLDVVIEHEATHHRHGHWRYRLVAVTAEQALAPLRGPARSADRLQAALEAWADEGAAGASTHRRDVARRTVLRVAHACGSMASDSATAVLERVRRLDVPPAAPALATRLSILMPSVALFLATTALAGGAAVGLHHAAVLDRLC